MISGGENGGFIFSPVDELIFIMGALIADKSNFISIEILQQQASRIIQAALRPLLLGSLFMGIANSAYACSSNLTEFLTMVIVNSVALALTFIIASMPPPFGFMAATLLSVSLDFIIKPMIQDAICT